MMKDNKGGFTLIELVVVVLIMGILASMGVPYYYKTVETSKATDAVALGHMIANAHRMFLLDHPTVKLKGQISSTCNAGACSTSDTTACRLVRCNYVAKQDWTQSSYDYYACSGSGGCCAADSVACTKRKAGASANYSGWGYRFSNMGKCDPMFMAPSCPKF